MKLVIQATTAAFAIPHSYAPNSNLRRKEGLGEEEAGHSLVDDDPVAFQVEFDAPLLERIGSEDARPKDGSKAEGTTGGAVAEGAGVLISRRRKGHSETLRVGMDALLAIVRPDRFQCPSSLRNCRV